MRKQTVALIGNPNCGKTTLFNDLTGANQRTGNWPGVTVDRKEGQYINDGIEITVVDLPGVYSLDAEDETTGLDELIARDYLLAGEADLIINIVDASNLERNLYLTTQIMEMGVPMVIALNMIDVARERELDINTNVLSQRLGCFVIPISAFLGEGIEILRSRINELINNTENQPTVVAYPAVIEDGISQLQSLVRQKRTERKIYSRWIALKLLEYEDRVAPELKGKELDQIVIENRHKIHQLLNEDIDIIVADSRYGFIRSLMQNSVRQTRDISSTKSDKIDQFVLNRWIGIPLFLVVMYLMFFIAINIGGAFIDFFDLSFGTVFVEAPKAWLESLNTPGWLIGFITSIGGGIQTVATFIPQIGILFVILSILEDSGYMARAAFVMDKLMRVVGLPGKVIVVMVMILSLLNSVGMDGSFGTQDSKDSILSATSQAVTPVFSPMGVRQENWPATVGIFTGVFAKEAMVGSLGSLYGQLAQAESGKEEEKEAFDFWGGISSAFASIPNNFSELGQQVLDPLGINIGNVQDQAAVAEEQEVAVGTFGQMAKRFDGGAGAFAYLLFVLMYFPCVAATGAVYRETNLGWTLLVALWTTGLGYWVATMFYQIATFTQHPGFSVAWIIGGVVVMAGIIFLLKQSRNHRRISSIQEREESRQLTH